MEMEKDKTPMIIIGNLKFDNVLIWPHKIKDKFQEFSQNECPSMSTGSYCTRPSSGRCKKGDKQRGEVDLLILHRTKGIIIVEVKSYGAYDSQPTVGNDQTGTRKRKFAYDQLDYIVCVLEEITKNRLIVQKVFALPFLSRADAVKRCQIKEGQIGKQEPYLLTKDNLFDDDINKAESEYEMESFRRWWDSLPDNDISPDLMKAIVARCIGTLSRPLETKDVCECSHIRTPCDAITLTGKRFRTLIVNFTKEKETLVTGDNKRVHLKGLPGSGRTTLLILKARKFLNDADSKGQQMRMTRSKQRHVVVVNLYRGTKGRPIGLHLFNAISKADDVKGKCSNRVHHLPIDVHDIKSGSDFFQQVKTKIEGAEEMFPQPEQILFVIDEVLPERFWGHILDTFCDQFKKSHVWCADGLISRKLEKFSDGVESVRMSNISRLPPSIQRLLYHADWEEVRKKCYSPDAQKQNMAESGVEKGGTAHAVKKKGGKTAVTEQAQSTDGGWQHNLCTNGPTPVCVRHQAHGSDNKLIDCEKCARELGVLMKDKLKLVESADTRHFLPSAIAIIFSTPQDVQPSGEIAAERLEEYTKSVRESTFMKVLVEAMDPVKITVLNSLAYKEDDLETKELWDNIIVSWTDTFQGLERDVVIFLPGDTSHAKEERHPYETRSRSSQQILHQKERAASKEHSASESVITRSRSPTTPSAPYRPGSPQPSTSAQSHQAEAHASKPKKQPLQIEERIAALELATDRIIPVPGFSKAEKAITDPPPTFLYHLQSPGSSAEHQTSASELDPRMAYHYWKVEDVNRYTEWDKTNLVFAATRCTSQLILLIP